MVNQRYRRGKDCGMELESSIPQLASVTATRGCPGEGATRQPGWGRAPGWRSDWRAVVQTYRLITPTWNEWPLVRRSHPCTVLLPGGAAAGGAADLEQPGSAQESMLLPQVLPLPGRASDAMVSVGAHVHPFEAERPGGRSCRWPSPMEPRWCRCCPIKPRGSSW